MKVLSVILVILAILLVAFIIYMFFYMRKMNARQAESQKMIDQYTQKLNLLIIDKKMIKLKDAPFPKEVYEQAPPIMKFQKVCVVKAKVGPKVFNLMCERRVYDMIPVKTNIMATVSGLYITEVLKGAVFTEKELKRRQKEKAKAEKKAGK